MKLPRATGWVGGVALVGLSLTGWAAIPPGAVTLTLDAAPIAIPNMYPLTPLLIGASGFIKETSAGLYSDGGGYFRPVLWSAVSYYGAGNKLAFWYQVTSQPYGTDAITFMGIPFPAGSAGSVKVHQGRVNPSPAPPTYAAATGSFLSDVVGDVVGFNYSGANVISTGKTSAYAVIFTDYTSYSAAGVGPMIEVQFSNAGETFTVSVEGIGPVVVPEPGTYALVIGLGLVGFAAYRRSVAC